MAAKYRKIDPRIWTDEKFNQLDAPEALVVLWVLTTPHLNRIGVVVCNLFEFADKCRIDASKCDPFDSLSKACSAIGWQCERIGRSDVVITLPKWFRYNPPTNVKHLQGQLSDIDDMPRCDIITAHLGTLKNELPDSFGDTFDSLYPPRCKAYGIAYRNQKQKQKQKTEAVTVTEAEGAHVKNQSIVETKKKRRRHSRPRAGSINDVDSLSASDALAGRVFCDPAPPTIPPTLDTPAFREVWQRFLTHYFECNGLSAPFTTTGQNLLTLSRRFLESDIERCIADLELSISASKVGNLLDTRNGRASGVDAEESRFTI